MRRRIYLAAMILWHGPGWLLERSVAHEIEVSTDVSFKKLWTLE